VVEKERPFLGQIPQANITLEESVGKGPYWVLQRGRVSLPSGLQDDVDESHVLSDGSVTVTVKVPHEGKDHSLWEQYLTHRTRIRHPHLIHVFGICPEKQPPWVVMELFRDDLLSALTDPSRFNRRLDSFCVAYDREYTKNLFSNASPSMYGPLQQEIDQLQESASGLVTSPSPHSHSLLLLLQAAESHWKERTNVSHSAFSKQKDEVFFFSFLSFSFSFFFSLHHPF
jgi:hypothetical protein